METGELLAFLREKTGLFGEFPEDKLRALIEGSTITTFEGNEAIIEFGEEGRFLGVLLSGKAEAAVTDNTGKKTVLSVLEPGSVFGEISLMTGNRTIAGIIGVTRCEALLIPHELFTTVLITHPPAIRYLSRTMARRTAEWEAMHRMAAEALVRSDDPYGLTLRTGDRANLLVVNCGSSSLKYALFDTSGRGRAVRGAVERLSTRRARHVCRIDGKEKTFPVPPDAGHREAFAAMAAVILDKKDKIPGGIGAVGHRVVHGGDRLSTPAVIDKEVMAAIEEAAALAPLHNPVNLLGIREALRLFPHVPHVAVFDTGFHHTMPPYAYMYGLPYDYYKKKRIRRYGFHGTSHFYASLRAAEFLKRPFNALEIISCHLGGGASLCAVDHGRSVDTTMGFTPAEGVLMGTRCGDLDPGVLIHLMRTEKSGPDALEKLVNSESGFRGVSGITSDMRELEKAAREGHHRALLAYKRFCYQIRKYIGAYTAAMQGLDVVLFTGGIGEGSAGVRSLACQGLGHMGIDIDEEKNRRAAPAAGVTDIAADRAPVRVLVVGADEERMIARETIRAVSTGWMDRIIRTQKDTPIPIEVSAHHVHLSQEHVEALFGSGSALTPAQALSQKGQFACRETVALVGPKGRVERVRVLGPARRETQVEIAMTEQFKLGIDPPIRESGDLENTPGITIEGTAGSITLDKGVICAMRHIHMPPGDALRFGLRDRCRVRVRVEGRRELTFGDVLIRVDPSFTLAMHIDTDEANAADIAKGASGRIAAVQAAE